MDFLPDFITDEMKIFFMSMLPVIELRGAIPVGIAMGFSHMKAMWLCFFGSMVPVPFIMLLFKPITKWMRTTRTFNRLADGVINRTMKKKGAIKKFGLLGLIVFVAVPLPGTGVWSGSFLSSLLNIRFKYAFPAVAVGNMIAGLIVLSLSFGIIHIVN